MSVKVMAAVWECEALDQSERLVMLALADHSDDDGRCYPSISRLCKRTSMTDRGVQKVIARLVEKGFVSIVQNGGRGGANLYLVSATPERRSPPNDVHPRTTFTTPPNVVPKTPEPRSPEPSRTIIEPSTSSSRQRAVTSAAFDRFWAVYPKKVEKKTAQAKFSAAVKGGVDPERIISAAAAYARSPSVTGGFVKHPTTWLNAGCWDDEPPQQIPNPTERDNRRSFLSRVASRGAA